MTFKPSRLSSQSATARRAAAALLLSAILALTGAAPSHAWGFGHPTLGAHERIQPAGGFLHFLLKLLGFTSGTPGTGATPDTHCTVDSGGTMDPNGLQ